MGSAVPAAEYHRVHLDAQLNMLEGAQPNSDGPSRGGLQCFLCNSAAREADREAVDTVRCRTCGLALTRAPEGTWTPGTEPGAVEYPESGADLMLSVEDRSFWFHHRNSVISTLLDAHTPGTTILDIGGGNGFQALHLQEAGRHVVMVEPGASGCRNARNRGVRNVVRSTLEGLCLRSGSATTASLLDVLEHLPDPAPLLAETHRVLRACGKLLVTVPAYRSLWSHEDVQARHQRRYTSATLRRELESAGFHVDYIGYYFQFLVLPVLVFRVLPYRLLPWRAGVGGESTSSEHVLRPAAQRWVDRLLSHELAAIQAGRALTFGSSVVAVASPRARSRES